MASDLMILAKGLMSWPRATLRCLASSTDIVENVKK
jgi:hypothetical protein